MLSKFTKPLRFQCGTANRTMNTCTTTKNVNVMMVTRMTTSTSISMNVNVCPSRRRFCSNSNSAATVAADAAVFQYPKRLEVDYNAGGVNVWVFCATHLKNYNCVNHGQGFPNWESPPFVKEALKTAVDANYNQYALPTGHPYLIDIISEIYTKRFMEESQITNPAQITGANIQTTIGACAAIENTCQALLEDGDEVLTFEPYFDFYKTQVHHAGGVLKTVPLIIDAQTHQWKADIQGLANAINPKTRIIILNSPHNPTGYVMSKQELQSISEIVLNAQHSNLYIISDEVYEDIIFDEHKHVSIASLSNEIFNRTLTVNSAAKKFSVTGWKIGWVVGPAHLLRAIHFVTRGQNWCQATPLQVAVSQMLTDCEAQTSYSPHAHKSSDGSPVAVADMEMDTHANYYSWLQSMYTEKRGKVIELINASGFMQPLLPNGSFFAVADAQPLIDKLIAKGFIKPELFDAGDANTWIDWQLVSFIAEHANVICLPMSAFLSESFPDRYRYLRFSFCVTDEAFERSIQGMTKLKQFLQ